MRYVIAMIGAVVVATLATVFISSRLASLVVGGFTFESPDEVADLHAAVFMGTNVIALVIGWGIGWAIGGRVLSPRSAPS